MKQYISLSISDYGSTGAHPTESIEDSIDYMEIRIHNAFYLNKLGRVMDALQDSLSDEMWPPYL